ncbi:MAG: DegT/DnrJ/EryC1/StrS family aminotransferase [Nanoarchaeota archaeon]
MIPFVDLKQQHELMLEEISEAFKRVCYENSFFILGKELEAFEGEFADYCEKKFGIGVNSGTDALELALRALDIGVGDEVITSANTAIPTVMAIISVGAMPVLVDVGVDYLIDAKLIEKSLTERTRAIIPVHLYGQACDMEFILDLARKNNIEVIEDCCQAHGAEYKGKRVPIGGLGCFSFYPTKNLGALGDGGMIVTNREILNEKLKLLRNYGQSDKYHAKTAGRNSRLDELQAAILRAKLKHLDEWNNVRRNNASIYTALLSGLVETPKEVSSKHVYHLYVIRTEKRDELAENLKSKGIGTMIHYPIPIHMQEAFNYLGYKKGDFPNSEKFAEEILSLPMFPGLKENQIVEIAEKIKEFFG